MTLLEKMSDLELSQIKKFGYFLGSFDPLHKGHITVVDTILNNNICDVVMVYCVNGKSTYKQRSDFYLRTAACEKTFLQTPNVIISYMNPLQIQKKLTVNVGKFVKYKFDKMKISCIIGSDIVINLEFKNRNENLEAIRLKRQKDYMSGQVISDYSDSLVCVTGLPADDFIVALRRNHKKNDIPTVICGRTVSSIIDTNKYRFVSSSLIRAKKL